MTNNEIITNTVNIRSIEQAGVPLTFLHDGLSIHELGDLTGCAINYKLGSDPECIAYTSGYSCHASIVQALREEMNKFISPMANETTIFGFVTDKNYFVDRMVARLIYNAMCQRDGVTFVEKRGGLYSHDVNWTAFRKDKVAT